jgi:hypothetical protein
MAKQRIELSERQVQALAHDALVLAASVKLGTSDTSRLKAMRAAERVLKLLWRKDTPQ